MLKSVLKRWLWDTYDAFWRLTLANFVVSTIAAFVAIAFLAILPAAGTSSMLAAALLAALLTVSLPLIAAPWLAATLHFLAIQSAGLPPRMRHFVEGIRLHGPRMAAYLAFIGFLQGALIGNLWFYTASGFLGQELATIRYLLAGLCLWLMFFVAASALHGCALIARAGSTPLQALRVSVALLFAKPLLTSAVLVILGVFWFAASWCKFLGVLLIAFSASAALINALHDEVLLWEREVVRRESIPEEERRALMARYGRTFRDLLRPWEP